MARGNGSMLQGTLPLAKKYNVAAINWGLVAGKTQTYLPWDSWQHPYTDRDPAVGFHEIFRTDGTPYSADETAFIKQMTGRGSSSARAQRELDVNGAAAGAPLAGGGDGDDGVTISGQKADADEAECEF